MHAKFASATGLSNTLAVLVVLCLSCSTNTVATNARNAGLEQDACTSGTKSSSGASNGSGSAASSSGSSASNSSGTTAANGSGSAASSLALTSAVYYTGTIDVLLKANCTACHGASGTSPDLSSFSAAKSAAAMALADIKAKKMPPSGSGLSDSDLASFQGWVDGGTLQDAPAAAAPASPSPAPAASTATCVVSATAAGTAAATVAASAAPAPAPASSTSVTYDANIKAFLTANCTSCHTSGKTSPDLSSASAAKAAADDIVNAMKVSQMPPPPASAISDGDQANFKAWISAGFP